MSTSLSTNLSNIANNVNVQSVLSPSGAIGTAVGDILSAAEDVGAIINTANAELSTFRSILNDPIQLAFAEGQQYAGTFITAATAALMPIALAEQALASSTFGVALLSSLQLAVLIARTGINIVNDVDLAMAMGSLFTEFSSNQQLGFSISLYNNNAITPYSYTPTIQNSYSIYPLSQNPIISSLEYFVSQVAGLFPNTTNIGGIIASVWVDGLGITVGNTGIAIDGIPSGIDQNLYQDITGNASSFSSTAPTVVINYSYQQNYFNTVIALCIDNGLSTTFTNLMTSPLVNDTTRQVIKNRLPSAALCGNTEILIAMINALGANNIPNAINLLATIITNVRPIDIPITNNNPITFYAGGNPIVTTTPQKTLAQITTDITTIATTLNLTTTEAFTQNTCNSIFCSQPLLNIPMLKAANSNVLNQFFTPDIIKLANVF